MVTERVEKFGVVLVEEFNRLAVTNDVEDCPFCGSFDLEVGVGGDQKRMDFDVWVACKRCTARGPTIVSDKRTRKELANDLLAKWNVRKGHLWE